MLIADAMNMNIASKGIIIFYLFYLYHLKKNRIYGI